MRREQEDLFGAKSANLAIAARAGFPVPDGLAISASSETGEIRDSLPAWLNQLDGPPWIARSSGVTEDSATRSFAGQYESFLGLTTTDAVIDAVGRVRASGRAAHVAQYAGRRHEMPIGVLVQRMITAERAGVCFTQDPAVTTWYRASPRLAKPSRPVAAANMVCCAGVFGEHLHI